MFWFKKLVAPFVLPFPFALMLGVAGALLLGGRRRNTGAALLALAIVVLLAAGNQGVSRRLLAPLENTFPALGEIAPGAPIPSELAACRHIVVLGGGSGDRGGLAALDELNTSSRARLTEALRLSRLLPRAGVVFSGPVEFAGEPRHAQVMARAAASLGLDAARVTLIDDAHDTEVEAARIKAIVGADDFALVTSAWHLPRAMALCRKLGLHAFPCPTDFLDTNAAGWQWRDFTWNVESLQRSTWAVHERLGLWWSRMRGHA